MPLTVRDLLSLRSISSAGGHVVAGGSGLDQEVTRTHVGAIADIATFLSGGEFLLTAGQGIGGDAESQRSYVDSLAQAGVAALLLESAGRVFDSIPDGIRSACDERGLPLLSVGGEIAFEEVSQEVDDQLLDIRTRSLEEMDQVSSDLIRILMEHHDLEPALAGLAAMTDALVVLEQTGRAVRWSSPPADAVVDDSLAEGVSEGTFELGCPVCLRPPRLASGDPRVTAPLVCTRAELPHHAAQRGVLHVLQQVGRHGPVAQRVVDRAAELIGLLLAAESAVVMRTDRELSRALTSMLTDSRLDDANARRLAVLAPTLKAGHVLVLVLPTPPDARVAQQLRRATSRAVVIEQDARTVVLVGQTLGADPRVHAAELVRAWKDADALRTAVGCAAGHTRDLPAVARQAVLAAAFARRRPSEAGVLFVDDVPLERLLAPLAADGSLAAYRQEVLGVVLEHDQQARAPLLPTLEALVESGGNRSAAANSLHLERRTVQTHVARLEKLLGAPLDDPGRWLRLTLAIQAPSLSGN